MRAGGIILDKDKNNYQKHVAEFYRTLIIFFAGVFFTCVVGLIELLPEFETVTGSIGRITLTILYFGLLSGILFSINKCFLLYEKNKTYGGQFGFIIPDIELFHIKRYHLKPNDLEKLLISGFLSVFVLLYLVKIGLLP